MRKTQVDIFLKILQSRADNTVCFEKAITKLQKECFNRKWQEAKAAIATIWPA